MRHLRHILPDIVWQDAAKTRNSQISTNHNKQQVGVFNSDPVAMQMLSW